MTNSSPSRSRSSLVEQLRILSESDVNTIGFPGQARQLMKWAADTIEAANSALSERAAIKVHVVIGGWDYGGFSEPTGVYSSKEKAEDACQHAREEHTYDRLEVIEYDLDVGEREAALATNRQGDADGK